MSYTEDITTLGATIAEQGSPWRAISAEHATRMRLQNRFNTGLDIAKYTAAIMRKDMAEYDADNTQYTPVSYTHLTLPTTSRV